ncbi:MAG: hypothetical protein IKQ92_02210 [Clostridia bacterium]|nr:hypothetical protein [Clostridia bacterium]
MPIRRRIRALVVEQNPLFADGSRLSDLLKQTADVKNSVEELRDDIRFGSHGLVEVEIAAWETVDEFPRHKVEFRLPSGPSHSLNEETVCRLYEKGWYGWWSNEWFTKEVCPDDVGFSFDYSRLLERHRIVERRRAGEFDLVLLVNLDPVYCFEACMFGKNAYWINGDPIEADCLLTAILNVSVSRRDANFECFGHMMENVMMHVFTGGSDCAGYAEHEWDGIPYEKLNLWQKFTLANRNYDGTAACGNVHFSPNSVRDYDWQNPTPVLSTWRDWHDHYPALTGETELFDPSVYIPKGIGEKHACRLHHRWWFSCMPHARGADFEGYSNNWWDYFVLLDYAEKTEADENGVFTFVYRSGRTESFTPPVFENETCEALLAEPLCAVSYDADSVTVKKDGKSATAPRRRDPASTAESGERSV